MTQQVFIPGRWMRICRMPFKTASRNFRKGEKQLDQAFNNRLRKSATKFLGMFKAAAAEFMADHAMRLSAALAYYSAFSLAPLLLIAISIAGLIFGEAAARGVIQENLTGAIGRDAALTVQDMMSSARPGANSLGMAVIGLAVLLASASGGFVQLKDAMNTVWGLAPRRGGGIARFLRSRLLSWVMVLFIGMLLLISLILSALTNSTNSWLTEFFATSPFVWQSIALAFSLAIIPFLFAVIFRILPDAKVSWRDVWPGALVTSVLFLIGKSALALYLGKYGAASTQGAAGALILILAWIYYSTNILLFGAEFTKVYARTRGQSQPTPTPAATTRLRIRRAREPVGKPMPKPNHEDKHPHRR